jgi:hypothetical protein
MVSFAHLLALGSWRDHLPNLPFVRTTTPRPHRLHAWHAVSPRRPRFPGRVGLPPREALSAALPRTKASSSIPGSRRSIKMSRLASKAEGSSPSVPWLPVAMVVPAAALWHTNSLRILCCAVLLGDNATRGTSPRNGGSLPRAPPTPHNQPPRSCGPPGSPPRL